MSHVMACCQEPFVIGSSLCVESVNTREDRPQLFLAKRFIVYALTVWFRITSYTSSCIPECFFKVALSKGYLYVLFFFCKYTQQALEGALD